MGTAVGTEIFGQAFWPGVKSFISCQYTCSQGISPGVATLVVPIQPEPIPAEGTLTIQDGVNPPVRLPNCRIAGFNLVTVQGGAKALAIQILDRRWAWKYGRVFGWYNQPDPNPDPLGLPAGAEFTTEYGPFVPGTIRSPQRLMKVCLDVMGETGARFDGVPAAPRPPCDWSCANPAAALQQVADAVDCRVCYQPEDDSVRVTARDLVPDYQGANWPTLDDQPGFKVASAPDGHLVVAGPSWVCYPVPLEPVGPEKNGEWKPLDELSYKPEAGWAPYTPERAESHVVQGGWDTLEEAKQATAKYIWRTYRPKVSEDSPLTFPDPSVPKVTHRRQLKLGGQVYLPDKDVTGQYLTRRAYVTGAVERDLQGGRVGAYRLGDAIDATPSIDADRGLVTFNSYVFQWTANATGGRHVLAPDLWLVTSFQVRHPADHQLSGWEHYDGPKDVKDVARKLGRSPAAEVLHRPELWAVYVAGYGDDPTKPFALADVRSNEKDLEDAAKHYVAAAKKKLDNPLATTRRLAGIYAVSPGGVVEQVTWSVGGGQPATTTIGVNTEHDPWTPPYAERRRNERADRPLQGDENARRFNPQLAKWEKIPGD